MDASELLASSSDDSDAAVVTNAKVRGDPDKMKKQADIAKTAADSHQGQADKMDEELKAYDSELSEQMKRRKELEESIASRRAFLEGMSAQLASITTISMPLQGLLRHRLTSRWTESKQIKLLPPALKRLFERALAHRVALVLQQLGDGWLPACTIEIDAP